ncbi:MAG: aminodeoxychorismate synthase component I [Terrimesophilobacter sp.]
MRPRVLTTVYRRWIDPEIVFAALYSDDTNCFWLDSGIGASHGKSYLGSSSRTFVPGENESVLEFLRAELNGDSEHGPSAPTATGFRLGWVGWLGYERRAETMGVAVSRHGTRPDVALLYADRVVVFDHQAGTVALMTFADEGRGEFSRWRERTVAALDALGSAGTHACPAPLCATESAGGRDTATVRWAYSDSEYLAMIESCQEAIRRGDAYQLCLTNEAHVDVRPDPLTVYRALRVSSPTPHAAFIRIGGTSLLSATPELFLSVTPTNAVQTRPIKGTRRRGATGAEDSALRRELVADEKERAENLMIVDLMRNDLSRICAVGTVNVPSLLAVESFAQVHQLVSTITGQLADGRDGLDAVAACFPAGSMTGAPKLRATQLLDELEQRPRGIYSGVFGYFSLDGSIELAMVIRSIVIDAAGATVGAGGGITALSVPTAELAEVGLKAAALLAVLGVPVADSVPVAGRAPMVGAAHP